MINGRATKCENLKELTLTRLGSYDLCHISNAIYLIRCLPNLQILRIALVRTKTLPHLKEYLILNKHIIKYFTCM